MVETEPPIRCGGECGCIVGAILYDIHMSVVAIADGDRVINFSLNIGKTAPAAGSLIVRNSTAGNNDRNAGIYILKNIAT